MEGEKVGILDLDLDATLHQLRIDFESPYFLVWYMTSRYPQDAYRKWRLYAVTHDLEDLQELIPEEFHRIYSEDQPNQESYFDLQLAIQDLDLLDRDSVEYFITVSEQAYITANQARILVGELPNNSPTFLSRVVDKSNLGGSLVEDIYRRTIGRPPNYRVLLYPGSLQLYIDGLPVQVP